MKVLLIGSGGRESALAYKISQSESLTELFIAPGNPGTKQYGRNVILEISEHDKVVSFCRLNDIDLVVIGPEKPLVDGLSDTLRQNNFVVFGPSSKAAEIEASKSFAKSMMEQFNIPTAAYKEFSSAEIEQAKEYLKGQSYPIVIKADGLAAGKGVLICNDYAEAESGLNEIFVERVFGSSGDKLIIEEFMDGEEASIFAITDGEDFICLPSAQDHKRIGDNDTGKNTGGMGAYSPAPVITAEIIEFVENNVIKPALVGMKELGRTFTGCLYCGLMLTKSVIKVVEFNCRFGDPETQAVLPLLKGDFLKLLYSSASGKIDHDAVSYASGASVCVVVSSAGYPDSYNTGFEITGLDKIEDKDVIAFHAGTAEKDGRIVTAGGRVLGVTSVVDKTDLITAQAKVYEALKGISFEGSYYRKDIADRAIKRKS